jgi:hypothetical protein
MADEDTLRAERAVAEEEANQWAYVLWAVLPIVEIHAATAAQVSGRPTSG